MPVIAGHEAAGIVDQVGPGVVRVRVGDRVVVSLLRSCGTCYYCARAETHLCVRANNRHSRSRLRNMRGQRLEPGMGTAAFADCTVVHESQVVPVPPELPFDRAALLACGVLTGFGAVVNTAKVGHGDSIVVLGAGGVGLNAVQAAAIMGAGLIVAVDIHERKLSAARLFGATHVVDATSGSVEATVKELTGDRGADFVFLTTGDPDAFASGLKILRPGGALVLVGLPRKGAEARFTLLDFVSNECRILGSFMGSSRVQTDIPKLIRLYREKRLKLDELITRRYQLDDINEAMQEAGSDRTLRNVIVFSDG